MQNQLIIVLAGYFAGHTGYNVHTTKFAEALAERVTVVAIDWQQPAEVNHKKLKEVQAYCLTNPKCRRVNVHINHPSLIEPHLNWAGEHVAFVIWESTVLPPSWLQVLHRVNQIWAPSEWGVSVLESHGLPKEKLYCVPEGVDARTFNTNVTALPHLSAYPGFKFVHVGKFESRKGTESLIKVFDQCFTHEPVYLVLLSHNPFIPGFNINELVDQMGLRRRQNILCIDPLPTQQYVAALFAACDAAVFPTKAEGWGLPIMDAMACGLPTIVTDYSGVTQYVSEETNLLLDFKLQPIQEKLFNETTVSYGEWAQPNLQQLAQHLRYCVENTETVKQLGAKASAHVCGEFSWQQAAEKALSALLE